MPLNAGAAGYESVPGPGPPEGEGASETAPLLAPEVRQWRPLSRQELQAAAGGSGWRAARCYLVLLFWLAWFAMLAVAVVIVVLSPRPVPTALRWWQRSLFYRVELELPAEGQAGGSEVIGGKKEARLCAEAVSERFPHLRALGIGALILEGQFDRRGSPNHNASAKELETVAQIQHLLTESSKAGLRVVLDICKWALGVQDEEGNLDKPSNHSFFIEHVLGFWLEQGVSGFVICDTSPDYSVETLLEWRRVLDNFSTEEDERILIIKQTKMQQPLNISREGNITLVNVFMKSILPKSDLSVEEVAATMETQLKTSQNDVWPSWTVGGEVTPDLKRLVLVLMMTLPGSPAFHDEDKIDQTRDNKTKLSATSLFTTLSHSKGREEALLYGSFTFLPFNTSSNSTHSSPAAPVLAFLRSWGCVHFLILLNVWSEPQTLEPSWCQSLPEKGVFVASTGMNHLGSTSLPSISVLQPHEAMVIKLYKAGDYK